MFLASISIVIIPIATIIFSIIKIFDILAGPILFDPASKSYYYS